MDEFTLELKREWLKGMKYIPQAGLVSKLFQEVPRPDSDEVNCSLPMSNLLPLHCKFPNFKGMKFSRGRAIKSANNKRNLDFITYDPYGYEVNTNKYDSLYDPHLENYFKSENICKFLKKTGVLDDENQPICSLADINSYRFYLSRIHKDAVKQEYKRLLNERNERNQWRTAQIGLVKKYFKNINKEKALNILEAKREQMIKEKRTKKLQLYERLKNKEKKLAEREEKEKLDKLFKNEVISRKRIKYEKVLAKGKEIARAKVLKTLVGMEKKETKKVETMKNKEIEDQLRINYETEKNLFNKIISQLYKINVLNEIGALKAKSLDIKNERRLLAQRKRRQNLKDHSLNKQLKGPNAVTQKSQRSDVHIEDNKGLDYIVSELNKFSKKDPTPQGNLLEFDPDKNLLRAVARHLIRRAVYINIKNLCNHFVMVIVSSIFSTLDNDLKMVESSSSENVSTSSKPPKSIPPSSELFKKWKNTKKFIKMLKKNKMYVPKTKKAKRFVKQFRKIEKLLKKSKKTKKLVTKPKKRKQSPKKLKKTKQSAKKLKKTKSLAKISKKTKKSIKQLMKRRKIIKSSGDNKMLIVRNPKTDFTKYNMQLNKPITSMHLRNYLTEKNNLLKNMYTNAKFFFNLVRYRVFLLLSVGDPYKNLPTIRQKIMKNRKIMSIQDIKDSLVKFFIKPRCEVNTYQSSCLGTIANLLAYAYVLKSRQLIIPKFNKKKKLNKTKSVYSIKDPCVWKILKYIFKMVKTELDKSDNEEDDISVRKINGKQEKTTEDQMVEDQVETTSVEEQ